VPRGMVHTEFWAADVRYAVVVTLLVIVAVQGGRRWAGRSRAGDAEAGTMLRPACMTLTACFVAAWTLWLATSGNSRYFLPIACVASVLAVLLLERVGARPGIWGLVAGALLLVQGFQTFVGSDRREGESWAGSWIQAEVDQAAASTPHLYLSVDSLSGSFLLPKFAPGSGMANISGGYVVVPHGPGGSRVRALIDRYKGHVRTLQPVHMVRDDGSFLPPPFDHLDSLLIPYGLQVDRTDCSYFRVQGGWPVIIKTSHPNSPTTAVLSRYFLSCAAVEVSSTAAMVAYLQERAEADRIFSNVEAACPRTFQPKGAVSEKSGTMWRRYYVNTDTQLWLNRGMVKYANTIRGGDSVVIGTLEEWISQRPSGRCQ